MKIKKFFERFENNIEKSIDFLESLGFIILNNKTTASHFYMVNENSSVYMEALGDNDYCEVRLMIGNHVEEWIKITNFEEKDFNRIRLKIYNWEQEY